MNLGILVESGIFEIKQSTTCANLMALADSNILFCVVLGQLQEFLDF